MGRRLCDHAARSDPGRAARPQLSRNAAADGAGFLSVLHWPKLKALVGLEVETEPRLRLKREALPKAYLAGDLAALLLLEALPYLEELWRDWRANPGRLVPPASLSPNA